MISAATPSQTVGPYFAIGLPWDAGPLVVPLGTPGMIRVGGSVRDGGGAPVPDALIETWQPDPDGRFADLHGHEGPGNCPDSAALRAAPRTRATAGLRS